jgi:hypothetical protein
MRFKTLLLGTAAAFSLAGGAQAADLAVAEPVEYVKVCDVFGAGFWYIPGTDTCLKIGGYAKLTATWYDSSSAVTNYSADGSDDYSASWGFTSEMSVQATAQTLSDLGLVTIFADIRSVSDDATQAGSNRWAYGDSWYGQVGWFKFGQYAAVYDEGGTYTDGGSIRHDEAAVQVSGAWNLGGLGVWVGVADPRWTGAGSANYSGDSPAVSAKIGGSWDGWSAYLSGGYVDTVNGSGYGGQLVVTADFGFLQLRGAGSVANSAGAVWATEEASSTGGDAVWATYLTGRIKATDMFNINGTIAYAGPANGADAMWNAAAGVSASLTKNVEALVEYQHSVSRAGTDSDKVFAFIKASY